MPAWDPDSPFLTKPLFVRVLLLFYHGIKPTLHLASEPTPFLHSMDKKGNSFPITIIGSRKTCDLNPAYDLKKGRVYGVLPEAS